MFKSLFVFPMRLSVFQGLAWIYLFSGFALADHFASSHPDSAPILSLDAAVAQALEGNPGLKEIKARAEAMAAIPSQAGSLPDPSLSFEARNLPADDFNLRKEDMSMLEVAISQDIPFPGKLALQEQAAEANALAAADSAREARLRLVRDVKVRWWRVFYDDRALDTLNDTAAWLDRLVETTQKRYELGQSEQQEVLMAKLERIKLKDERLEMVGQRHRDGAKLTALLGNSGESPFQLPKEADLKPNEPPAIAALQREAEATRPVFSEQQHSIEAARHRLDLAHKDFLPDFSVGAGYGARQRTLDDRQRSDMASFRLSMTLPLYAASKQSGAVDQRRSELLKEQYALEDTQRKVHAEITAAYAAYLHGLERISLMEQEAIPNARQTVDALLASYRLGRTGFVELLRAEMTLYGYQSRLWQAISESQSALARLTAAVGKEAL